LTIQLTPQHKPITLVKEEILHNHRYVLCSFWNFIKRCRTGSFLILLEI